MKIIILSDRFARLRVPWSTLVLLPSDEYFTPIWKLDFLIVSKTKDYVIADFIVDTILRVKDGEKVKYVRVKPGDIAYLIGKKAKILKANTWGWVYYDPTDNFHIYILYDYISKRFKAIRPNIRKHVVAD